MPRNRLEPQKGYRDPPPVPKSSQHLLYPPYDLVTGSLSASRGHEENYQRLLSEAKKPSWPRRKPRYRPRLVAKRFQTCMAHVTSTAPNSVTLTDREGRCLSFSCHLSVLPTNEVHIEIHESRVNFDACLVAWTKAYASGTFSYYYNSIRAIAFVGSANPGLIS